MSSKKFEKSVGKRAIYDRIDPNAKSPIKLKILTEEKINKLEPGDLIFYVDDAEPWTIEIK